MALHRRRVGWTIAEDGKPPYGLAPIFSADEEGCAKAERCAAGATERTGVRHVVVEEWSETWETEDGDDTPGQRPRGLGTCRARSARSDGPRSALSAWDAWPGPATGRRVEPRRKAEARAGRPATMDNLTDEVRRTARSRGA